VKQDAALLNATCAVAQIEVGFNPLVKERADAISHASSLCGALFLEQLSNRGSLKMD